MKKPMDHDAVSQLLDRYVRGELAGEQVEDVRGHLSGCAGCSGELVALEALGAAEEPGPLTELERAGLRRAVLSEAVPLPGVGAEAIQAAPWTSRAGARWFQALGAAALVVAVAGSAYFGLNGSGGDDSSEISGADAPSSLEMESQELNSGAGGGTSQGETGTQDAAAPGPTFDSALRSVDSDALNRIAKRGLPLVVFSRAYSSEDVPSLQDDFVEQLAAQAGGARAENIRNCAALVFSQTPVALPAYAAEAVFEPDKGKKSKALVLGFAWTGEEQGGPLERSMVWAWHIGDCQTVFHYSEDVIRPRN